MTIDIKLMNVDKVLILKKPDEHQVYLFKILKAVDGIYIYETENKIKIVLIELKSRVDINTFKDVRDKFSGSYMNSVLLSKLYEFNDEKEIEIDFHLIYKSDAIRTRRNLTSSTRTVRKKVNQWTDSRCTLSTSERINFNKHLYQPGLQLCV